MTFTEALREAYMNQLCVDFYSCTITDPDGNEWYWNGHEDEDTIQDFVDVMKEVVEFREKLEE
jgi:hypothetical protein